MAERFTGFWEASNLDLSLDEMAMTFTYEEADVLLERLRERLASVPPGTQIHIDLIAWGPDE